MITEWKKICYSQSCTGKLPGGSGVEKEGLSKYVTICPDCNSILVTKRPGSLKSINRCEKPKNEIRYGRKRE